MSGSIFNRSMARSSGAIVVLHDIDEELRSHLEMEAEANRELGMTPEEARLSATKSFGNVGSIRDLAYEVRGGGFMETVWQDLRYSARMLFKHPGFTIVAVLTLSLGIGANTAIFSIVNAVLLRPFPYQAPEQLVIVGEFTPGGSVSYPNFAIGATIETFLNSVSAVRSNESYNFTGAGEPERLQGRLVSAGFLSLARSQATASGATFFAEDDRPGATPAVMLSYGFWSRRLERSKHHRENDHAQQPELHVVGVTPQDFQFGMDADVTFHRSLRGALQGTWRRSGNQRGRAFETERVATASGDRAQRDLLATGTTVSG
jgi:hypothetical protein